MNILTVNTGSSSVRLAVFSQKSGRQERVAYAHLKTGDNEPENQLTAFIEDNHVRDISVTAHRIVHGGTRFKDSCLINPGVEKEIDRLSILAPLHNPAALKWISICRRFFGSGTHQVAVFDTAFYSRLPESSLTYALPKDLCRRHEIQRYGFHGTAHSAMLRRWREIRPDVKESERLILLQLGAGCSVTAVKNGTAIDTSMGFSPVEGLVMATRSGDLDPGVIIYLQKSAGLSVEEIDELLNNSSGLLGVSGISSDMKTLLGSDQPDAGIAIELYCYRAKKYIGAYAAALGGVDAILFGGGVGENSSAVRKRILEGMRWCGIDIYEQANIDTVGKEGRISSDSSNVDVWVIPVDEASVLVKEAVRVVLLLSP